MRRTTLAALSAAAVALPILGLARSAGSQGTAGSRERLAVAGLSAFGARFDGELEFLRTVSDSLPSPYYVWSRDGRLLMANRAWEEATALKRADSLGKDCRALFPAAMAERFLQVNNDVLQKGAPVQAEEFVDRADGRHTYLTVKFPVRDRSGKVVAVGGVSIDRGTK